jgi:hypothetical protein
MTDFLLSIWPLLFGALAAGALFGLPGRPTIVRPTPAPIVEPVPGWLWRDNLEAAVAEMTLQDPTIDYDRVDSWTPYAESSSKWGDLADRRAELQRRSLKAAHFYAASAACVVETDMTEIRTWGRPEPIAVLQSKEVDTVDIDGAMDQWDRRPRRYDRNGFII